MKYFDNDGKMCSLRLKDDSALVKQDDTCNKIKEIKSMKFQRKSVHDEKSLKSRKYLFNGAVNTADWNDKISQEGIHYTCIATIKL